LNSTKSSEKTDSDGDITVRLNTRQIPPTTRWSSEKKRVGFIAAAILFASTAILLITYNHNPTAPAAAEKKPSTPQTTLASDVKPPPPAATESKITEGKPVIAARTSAILGFSVLPWGEIFIDGKSRGASPPLREIKLPPGKHKIEVRNADFPPYRQTMELEAGSSQKIKHKFK
jgi:serine/threonine-protein kinase